VKADRLVENAAVTGQFLQDGLNVRPATSPGPFIR